MKSIPMERMADNSKKARELVFGSTWKRNVGEIISVQLLWHMVGVM
jgi:hypothetical protein